LSIPQRFGAWVFAKTAFPFSHQASRHSRRAVTPGEPSLQTSRHSRRAVTPSARAIWRVPSPARGPCPHDDACTDNDDVSEPLPASDELELPVHGPRHGNGSSCWSSSHTRSDRSDSTFIRIFSSKNPERTSGLGN
jgi:hypothetical protein